MEIIKFRYYERKPCKFILKNGKTVFGIMWEQVKQSGFSQFLFASTSEYYKWLNCQQKIEGMPIELGELLYAEIIND